MYVVPSYDILYHKKSKQDIIASLKGIQFLF